jgi:hypothetical protein
MFFIFSLNHLKKGFYMNFLQSMPGVSVVDTTEGEYLDVREGDMANARVLALSIEINDCCCCCCC